MPTRVTFIGGPDNTIADGFWFTPEGQRLSFPLRLPVDLDLSTMQHDARRFAEEVLNNIRRMPDRYTVEDIGDEPQLEPVSDHQQERVAKAPRRKR